MDPEFQENIEQYFVENIKVGHIIYRHGVCVCKNDCCEKDF